MNARTLVLVGAIVLVGLGLLMTLGDLFSAPPPAATIQPAIARTQIQPYTVITQDMVAAGDTISQRDATARGLWQVRDVVGKMSTNLIAPGDALAATNAMPIEAVRFTSNPNLEIVSFGASVDRMVAGKIRPGSLVNIYGTGRDKESQNFTVLVEPRVWVVGVSSGGSQAVASTAVPDPKTGEVTVTNADRDRAATTLTVAVEPEKAFRIIDAFGAQGLAAYVTLAANQTADTGGFATPAPAATATSGLSVEISLTATALAELLKPTDPPKEPATGDGWGQP
jgi:hypothetical protein